MSNYLISKKHENQILEYSKNIKVGTKVSKQKEFDNPYSHAWLKLNRKEKLDYLQMGDDLLEDIKDAFYEAIEYSDKYLYEDRHQSIIEMYDERFFRMWEFYLLASKYSFVNMGNVVFQIQISKNINNLPLTRNYIYN